MVGKRWLIAGIAAILATAPGCICCNHQSYSAARDVGPECTVPLVERQKTYLFMVNGLVPDSSVGLNGLREELTRQGYSKIGSGQTVSVPWMAGEIRRIHADDASARFVLLGYDAGGPAAAWLANDLAAGGVPIDALILLDPVGKSIAPVRTLVVTSGGKASTSPIAETISIPECGHFTLPTHPKTVAAIAELLSGVASQTSEGQTSFTLVEPNYEHAQPKQPLSTPLDGTSPEWNFLFDVPGTQREPLTPIYSPVEIPNSNSPSLAPGLHSSQSARPRP